MPLLEEAGAVVARIKKGKAQVLLVTAKKRPNEWIFPKGHIERGESAEDAALRESEEEAGVAGHVVSALGELRFEYDSQKYRVQYFLVQYESTIGSGDGRRVLWHTLDDAIHVLSFANTREFLEKHRALIESRIAAANDGAD